jgi:hypothetical protein
MQLEEAKNVIAVKLKLAIAALSVELAYEQENTDKILG